MSTLRQIEANRRNAQKSTGPASATGKAVSAMNSLKTGIHAKSLVLPSEKLADLEQLIEEYHQHHQPSSPEARFYVDELVHGEWLLRRLRAAESQLWLYEHQESFNPEDDWPLGQAACRGPKAFGHLQWRMDSTRRAMDRALKALKQLRLEEDAEAQAAQSAPELPPTTLLSSPVTHTPEITSFQIGFVPSNSIRTLPQAPHPSKSDPSASRISSPPLHSAVDGCFRGMLP